MRQFLAIYIGTATAEEKAARQAMDLAERNAIDARGMQAWTDWALAHAGAIVDHGRPLGRTKRAAPDGITDTVNTMTGYVIVAAESHEAAARMFEGHPHFSIFPGDSVEIVECLSMPGMNSAEASGT